MKYQYEKYVDYLDLFARVVVILMSLFLCIRVLMISTELWRNIVVLVSTPITIYSLIKYKLDYKVYKNKERS